MATQGRYSFGWDNMDRTNDLEEAIREETGHVFQNALPFGLVIDQQDVTVAAVIVGVGNTTFTDADVQAIYPKARIIRLRASGAIDGYDLH